MGGTIATLILLALTTAGLASCGNGGGGSGGNRAPGTVTISGQLRYQRPSHSGSCVLDFDNLLLSPIRAVTVRVVDANSNSVLGSTVTDDNGMYAIEVASQTDMYVRARAELKRLSNPAWDVEVRDNTCDDNDPDRLCSVPLAQRPMYVLDSSIFSSGSSNRSIQLTAATGWDTSTASFSSVRAAAPFAALDTIYGAMLALSAVDPELDFPALDAFWSVNNTQVISSVPDVNSGELGSTFYQGGSVGAMFLTGAEGSDIDEFDSLVIAHEWGHYAEEKFSRSDSIGGAHGLNDNLDMRTAFSEGFATGLAGILLDDPVYCDSLWFGATLSGFGFSIESTFSATRGWFDEFSIQQIIYDLWDVDVDGSDTDSVGLAAIYDVMIGPQIVTPAFTSIFTFMEALKSANPAASAFVDALLAEHSINGPGIEPFASNETNAAAAVDVLPVYVDIAADGSISNICSNSQFDYVDSAGVREFGGNKLSMSRYLRLSLAMDQRLDFSIVADAATLLTMPPDDLNDPRDQSDPDILIFRDGVIQNEFVNGDFEGTSGAANQELFATENTLAAGEYVMDFYDFRFADPDTNQLYPSRTCFDITISAVP